MSKRIPQVNQLIKKELSQIILREIDFPRDILVTITRVESAKDLISAKAFISVMPEEKSSLVFKALNNQVYYLQQKLNNRLKMRPIPKIEFKEEKTTIEAARIEEILAKLKKKDK